MNMENFVEFKRFISTDQSQSLVVELEKVGIEYQLIDIDKGDDLMSTVDDNELTQVQLMVKESDLERISRLLEDNDISYQTDDNQEHFLYSFTNEELHEVLKSPETWHHYDYKLARKILSDRGEVVSDDQLSLYKQERIKELSKPEKGQNIWVVAGYVFSFIVWPVGMVFGWALWRGKKLLPNGDRVYVYNEKQRHHGKVIFVIGIFVALLLAYVRFILTYKFL